MDNRERDDLLRQIAALKEQIKTLELAEQKGFDAEQRAQQFYREGHRLHAVAERNERQARAMLEEANTLIENAHTTALQGPTRVANVLTEVEELIKDQLYCIQCKKELAKAVVEH